MAKDIQIHIAGMIYNQSMGGTYSLVMTEDGGQKRRFSVLIGESEAQSIALKLNNAKPPRPLSHDLMNNIIRELNARLIKVLIYEMVNDIFYAEIFLMKGETPIVIDARTSDAVALAVRSNAPIYIKSEILDEVGVVINEEESQKAVVSTDDNDKISLNNLTNDKLKNISMKDLLKLLDLAVKEEHYEAAALIRDEIGFRNS